MIVWNLKDCIRTPLRRTMHNHDHEQFLHMYHGRAVCLLQQP